MLAPLLEEVRKARARLSKLQEQYAATALDYLQGRTPTRRAFPAAEKSLHREIQEVTDRITELVAQRRSLPARAPLAQARQGQELLKLSTERKHLTPVLKLVAYQIESHLVELIRPHYTRTEHEGRTLIQAALQNTAEIQPADDELRITLAPLSSPHRSRAVAALCETLNKTNTLFPGTHQRMRFGVADSLA